MEVRPLAEGDVQAAFDWYEAQAEGLGHEFLRAVDACYAMIERWPEAFPVVYKRYRRALLRRFPYLVYYSVSDAVIEVVACAHGRQHPR
ncbi:MAG: type II toxin-antitoxin system RelE/ParE family toxin, partial [Gemmatimonadaceae bacterium]|nr:type II toxin-antitoxin system RelE/ParE family toxin [Gemmatimonadaceae bacterium]